MIQLYLRGMTRTPDRIRFEALGPIVKEDFTYLSRSFPPIVISAKTLLKAFEQIENKVLNFWVNFGPFYLAPQAMSDLCDPWVAIDLKEKKVVIYSGRIPERKVFFFEYSSRPFL